LTASHKLPKSDSPALRLRKVHTSVRKYKVRKAKLADDQAEELRRRAAAGENRTQLAKAYALSRETLYRYTRQGGGTSVLA
jgi:DNA invertase Pin-like site-specific DNA recombinase